MYRYIASIVIKFTLSLFGKVRKKLRITPLINRSHLSMGSHCSRMRQDTTIPVRKSLKYDLERNRPEYMSWNSFLKQNLLNDGEER